MAASAIYNSEQNGSFGKYRPIPVAAATIIYAGTLVCANASGYAVPAARGSDFKILGRAPETVDNSAGLAGAKTIAPETGEFTYDNHGSNTLATSHIGEVVYVEDDITVGNSAGTNGVKVGRFLGFVGSKCLIRIGDIAAP